MKALSSETVRAFGGPEEVQIYEELDSTNKEARRQIDGGHIRKPFLIAAETQTAGRGRLGRTFYSPRDNGIYMTLAVPLSAELEDAVFLTGKTAAAVIRGIQSLLNAALSVKWVNDIYMGDRKIAGILVESVRAEGPGYRLSWAVIGIGINVGDRAFPEELSGIAGSLRAERADRSALIGAVSREVLYEAENLRDHSYLDFYRRHSYVLGKTVTYGSGEDMKTGKAVAIDDCGGLVILLADGTTETLTSGEISVRVVPGEY